MLTPRLRGSDVKFRVASADVRKCPIRHDRLNGTAHLRPADGTKPNKAIQSHSKPSGRPRWRVGIGEMRRNVPPMALVWADETKPRRRADLSCCMFPPKFLLHFPSIES